MICLLLANVVRLNKVVTKWLNISLNYKAFYAYLGLPRWLGGKKNPSANAGDTRWIPGWGRSPGGGNGNPLQYSCLENSTNKGSWRVTAHGVTKSQRWLSTTWHRTYSIVQLSSATQSCPTLCDLIDCSMRGFPVHHQPPKLAQAHVHWAVTILSSVVPFSSCYQSFPASGSFPLSRFFASGSQSIGVSPSASVLPVNIQNWFPLGLTGWISLQSKGLSRVFSNTTVQKHLFFSSQLSL